MYGFKPLNEYYPLDLSDMTEAQLFQEVQDLNRYVDDLTGEISVIIKRKQAVIDTMIKKVRKEDEID